MPRSRKGPPVSEPQPVAFHIDQLASLAASMAGVGYWSYSGATDRFTWSEQMYRIYGFDPKSPPEKLLSLAAYCHPDDRAKHDKHRREHANVEDAEIEVRIVRPDGEIRHVIARSTANLGEAAGTMTRFGTLIDVTDIKRAEAAATESEQRYRLLADMAPDMIARTRVGGETLFVSPSSVRVLGYTPDEMASLNPVDMVHPDDGERVMEAFGKLIADRVGRLPEPLRYRARHKSGEWVWIEANPVTVFDDQGSPIEFIDVVRNVTQTKLFEDELDDARVRAEAAAAAKSTFLANMSHELRTPLTSIVGFSRLLDERHDLPEEARRYAARISDASEALLAVINDVLDFSKLEAGQVPFEMQPLSVARLVDETVGIIAMQAAAKGVEVRAELDPKAPALISGDVARLRQVLLNFLSNAVKFTDQGSVTVRTAWRHARKGGRMRVSVVDTGNGIAPHNVSRLFERFSQAEVSVNRTHGGTGLGLAISKGIVELLGGRIGVRSKLGQGSTFWFEIPCEPAAEAASQADETSGIDCPPLRILIVDDTSVNRELVKLMLAPLGFEIEEAGGGSDGVKAAMTRAFDLILMDVRMPGVDGLEATRVIRGASALNRATPILALTADIQPENAAACRAAGMNDVLGKPIVARQLLTKIVQWGAGAAGAGQPVADPIPAFAQARTA